MLKPLVGTYISISPTFWPVDWKRSKDCKKYDEPSYCLSLSHKNLKHMVTDIDGAKGPKQLHG